MAKLFGEYLVDEGLVTPENVLGALIAQLRAIPCAAEVAYDCQIFPAKDLLKVLTHQQCMGMDFRGSAEALGVWTPAASDRISHELQSRRRPLGEILVEMGVLSLESLMTSLHAYIESSGPAASVRSEPAPPAASPVAVEPAPPSSTILDATLTREYVEMFAGRTRPALAAAVARMQKPNATRGDFVQAIMGASGEFAALRAAAGFLGAIECESVGVEVVGCLADVLRIEASGGTAALVEVVETAGDLLDGFNQYLSEFRTESLFASDPNMVDLRARLTKAVQRARASASSAVA